MTAASSGDPGGSREQWPGLDNSTSDFGSLTYLQLTSKDENSPLMSNPFIVGKSVENAAGGLIEGASTEARGTKYTLKIRNQVQVNKLLKLSTLLDGTEIVVQIHPNLNTSRCVISCFETIRMEEKDVLSGLISQGVIRVQRITRKENGIPVNTSALILTFNRCKYPSYVKIGLLRISTRPYYPNPLLCYGCLRYGHPRVRCPGPKRCLNCSTDHELAEDEECSAAAHCINCGGAHRPNNRQCPVYKTEVEVIRLKVNHNLTYPEARKRMETGTGSYAAAAAQQTADRKKLDELAKKMEEKDAQISQLLEVLKKKDEKIDKLMTHIKQVRNTQIQNIQPNKPIQSSEAVESPQHPQIIRKYGESQMAGPSMLLRSRSPAITEPRNKSKTKRQNRSSNSSPGRQSPPLKKQLKKHLHQIRKPLALTRTKLKKRPLVSIFDNFSPFNRIPITKTHLTNETDHNTNRLEGRESVVPPSLSQERAQQAGESVRDVLPQPVDGESPSAVDYEIIEPHTPYLLNLIPPSYPLLTPYVPSPSTSTLHTKSTHRLEEPNTSPSTMSDPDAFNSSNRLEEEEETLFSSRLPTGEARSIQQSLGNISLITQTVNRCGEGEREVTSPLPRAGVDLRGEESGACHERLAPLDPSWNPAVSPARTSLSSSATTCHNDTTKCFALQWNIRGLRANISELKLLISQYEPSIIALQETKVDNRVTAPDFAGKNYALLLKTGNRRYWQQGVGLAIREGVPFERIEIDCGLQAIAVRIYTPTPMTVVSIYIPPNDQQCQTELDDLFKQLPSPILLLGDFNAHHPAWGSTTSNALGRLIAEKSIIEQLIILNDGSHTRIDPATGSYSTIDLSICSEMLAPKFKWRTLPDTHNSDHFPITVSLHEYSHVTTKRRRWLYDQADWSSFELLISSTIKPDDEIGVDEFTNRILSAGKATIPRTSNRVGPKSVPWWCPEVETAVKQRRKWLRALKRTRVAGAETTDALKKFQEAKALAKKEVKDAKCRSWEKFVGKISPTSTTAEMWHTVNILRGKRQHSRAVIKRSDGYTDNAEEVAEELARHYCERSATSTYPPSFQKVKEKAERNRVDVLPDTNDIYNTDFTLNELLWALDKGRSVSTGPDSIGYPMLRRLPLSVKTTLLDLLNKVWRSGIFPTNWRTGIVVPIPKPNSSESGPAAFRPITLTNCIAKVFERIVNRRLTTELESKGRFDKRQHAFRAGRGVDSYLAELDRLLPNTDEHCLIASLDIAKAYDTTWRFGILRTLRKWQIGGRMFNILNSFLAERTFRVHVEGHASQEMPLENGVPQGSVLSVTLFLVAMQPIFTVVPRTANVLLYADDILLVVRKNKEQPIYRDLQTAVRAVDKWAKSVGFKISATKSNVFYCSPNARRNPRNNICIDRVVVPKTKRLKIIGVTLDQTLTFKQHCKAIKTSCDSRLRILKIIGARVPRGQRDSLLCIGSAMITSRLLYGIGLVSRAKNSVIQSLAPVYNRMVRFASGAYVTSPIPAIMAEAGVLPFDLLALQGLVRAALRMLEKDHRNFDLPVVQRATDRLVVLDIRLPNITVRTRFTNRRWYEPKPRIIWDVRRQVKAGDPSNVARPVLQQLLANRFNHASVVYTDGSKCYDAVGAGVFGSNLQRAIGLPSQCSVFSAEAYAIKSALNMGIQNELIILSDSESCLLAIESGKSQHPWIQEIENLLRNRSIHLCWIPGHAGIQGNEEADRLAGEARNMSPLNIAIPRKDATMAMNCAIRLLWEQRWVQSTEIKLKEVKHETKKWPDQQNSADQRVLTRLRIGHTRLTHEFLLKKSSPPICECCGTVMDVRHIILHCRKYESHRAKYGIDPTSLYAALSNEDDTEKRLLKYLKETNIYRKL